MNAPPQSLDNPEPFEAPFLAWLESSHESAELARKLIKGETPLSDERARMNIARMSFFCGRQDGVAFAHGHSGMKWAQAVKS